MRTLRYGLVLVVACALAAPLLPAAEPTPPDAPARDAAERAIRERRPDTPGTGRFPAIKEEDPTLPFGVVYRPAQLQTLGDLKLGIYLFGSGACVPDGASSRLHLLEIASHGYLAIAPGRILSGPGAPATSGPAAGTQPSATAGTSYKDLLAALDWALAQNADPRSRYYQSIDPAAVAVSGYSCGGAQALRVAPDPRVKTLVMMNSGLFPDGSEGSRMVDEMNVPKATLKQLHSSVFYLAGGESDAAWVNANDDFRRIERVPVFYGNLLGVGHGGTYWHPNGGVAAATVVKWLDWQLRGDQQAAKTFVGKDCGLCRDKAWSVRKKRID